MTRRGFVPEDEKQFTGEQLELLVKAAEEVQFLLDRGYKSRPATTFISNHYLFSQRQRLALVRSVSPKKQIAERSGKELLRQKIKLPDTVHIDGFNVIITLETALSCAPVFSCGDGAIRDLAGLRGTYRIIDKTEEAIGLLLRKLDSLGIKTACFYLDAPVSNSGRLSALIREQASGYGVSVETHVTDGVDGALKKLSGVISSDTIILNECISWLNIMPEIVKDMEGVRMIRLQ